MIQMRRNQADGNYEQNYYDTDCEAHKKLKVGAKSCGVEGVLTTFFEPAVTASL